MSTVGAARKTCIPIPSFSFATTAMDHDDNGDVGEVQAGNTSTPPLRNMIAIETQWMLPLECALEFYFSRLAKPTKQKQQEKQQQPCISYDDFCALVPKLTLDASTTAATATTTIEFPNREQRLWHDLYCLATPTLYKVVVRKSTSNGNPKDEMVLELVPFAGNRSNELQTRIRALSSQQQQQQITMQQKSREVRDLLHLLDPKKKEDVKETRRDSSVQQQQQQQAVHNLLSSSSSSNSRNNNNSSTPATATTTGATIEERVRARAQQRHVHLQQAQQAASNPMEERLWLADILFNHARHILRRSSGNNNSNNKSKSTKCVLTFQDVVRVVPHQNRHQIAATLRDIQQLVPEWIKWVDPKEQRVVKNNNKKAAPLSKQTTLWIETADFKSVRARLNGETTTTTTTTTTSNTKNSSFSSPLSSLTNGMAAAAMAPVVTISGTKRTAQGEPASSSTATSGSSPRKMLKSSPSSSSSSVAQTAGLVHISSATTTTALAPCTPPPRAKNIHMAALPPPPPLLPMDTASNLTSTTPTKKKKRSASDAVDNGTGNDTDVLLSPAATITTTTITTPVSSVKKQRRGLRMNQDFILCDEDYNGGCVIQPSYDSPRGLKRLFCQMNAGQRI
jgi:hypothetical protein